MTGWLGKILGGGDGGKAGDAEASARTKAAPATDSAAPTPGRAASAPRQRPAKPFEPPLPPPRIVLEEADPAAASQGLLTRQVIIGRKLQSLGYVFALQDAVAGGPMDPLLRDQLLIDVVDRLGVERLCKFRTLWLPVSAATLATPAIERLLPKSTVLMVHAGDTPPDPALLDAARQLKARGFRLCLAGWLGTPAQRAWLPLIEHLEIDLRTYNPVDAGEIPQAVAKAGSGAGVMASHIESFEEFEFCQRANYFLFRGGFLTRRENWPAQTHMAPDRVTVCNLLNQLRAGAEIDAIAAPFRLSPELSYRFLRYINSAGFGLQSKVASVKQGMVFLGREKLYRWLTLLLFNPDPGRTTDAALLEQALVRARMMEVLGRERFSRVETDELFVVGIFSVLDLLLKLPMSVALDPLKLPAAVHGALVGDEGPFAPFLRLAVACEEGDTQLTASHAEALGLTAERVNAVHLDALAWAQETLGEPDA